MTPCPDVQICLDCGWSQFVVPRSWLSAGWVRPMRPQAVPNGPTLVTAEERALAG
jgi:hypothetical protein